ncbi:MAG: hypothetical protein K2H09_09700 [Treponemataceae bacterium]|nr:hypothetical protein [Treponemataceae bacterium]
MFEFEKMCKAFEQMKDGERKLCLQEQSAKIISAFERTGKNGMEMFLYLMGTACGADGHLSVEEYSLLQEVSPVQLKYNEARCLVEKFSTKSNKDAAQVLSEIVGMFDEDMQDTIILFCLCFCSADKNVSLKERRFIKSLVR